MFVIHTLMCILWLSPGTLSIKSYLDWPRIHFSGQIVAEPPTMNNDRCNYFRKKFTVSKLSPELTKLRVDNRTGTYEVGWTNWGPDGSGQFFFRNASVTSFCESPSENCSTSDAMVDMQVSELNRAAMAVLDPDWETTSTFFGLTISIAGILQGDFAISQEQKEVSPMGMTSTGYKSVLKNITWRNDHYAKLFDFADKLSISMGMDLYSKVTFSGRVTATIGPTSEYDPLTVAAYRAMKPGKNLRPAPFVYHQNEHLLLLDLSVSLMSDQDGNFLARNMGTLDLGLIISHADLCADHDCGQRSSEDVVTSMQLLTHDGYISNLIGNNNKWFEIFGGILTVNLSDISPANEHLLMQNRLAIIQREQVASRHEILMSEIPHGIRIGLMGQTIERANVGDHFNWTVFVTSFGLPLPNAMVSMDVMDNAVASTECGWQECNGALGVPRDSLRITFTGQDQVNQKRTHYNTRRGLKGREFFHTDENGHAFFHLEAQRNPGNPRGCDLDGQVYPIEIVLSYDGLTFVEGDISAMNSSFGEDRIALEIMPIAVLIYEERVQPDDPTWMNVKGIFKQYHNLFPVMWRNRIVDLGTYQGVKKSANRILFAMKLPITDPRYMPVTRDLSRSEFSMIEKWFDNGMKQFPAKNDIPSCSEIKSLEKSKKNLHGLLQRALTLELTTIPTYYTAWMSLKTELGFNLEVGSIIKSILVEEMFHMALAGNILNAVGGEVNLNDFANIPAYPTPLTFGSFYELATDIIVGLQPMSLGLVKDIFTKVEQPALTSQSEIFHAIACIWDKLKPALGPGAEYIESPIIARFLEEFLDAESQPFEKLCGKNQQFTSTAWNEINEAAALGLSLLATTEIGSIGSFYASVALETIFLESCAQMGAFGVNEKTIFSSNAVEKQIKLPPDVFPVTDLSSAVAAIIEIVYQGEGGSMCSPYVYEDSKQISHYYRFQEIVHGRRLVEVTVDIPIKPSSCLQLSSVCAFLNPRSRFCYIGEPITFNLDGIWPMVSNPSSSMYVANSNAEILNIRFNTLYTDLLRCLNRVFNGDPDSIGICITKMHDMTIVGKILARTPVLEGIFARCGENVAPTWSYVRNQTERAGLPILIR